MANIYRQKVMLHFKEPQNKGRLKNPSQTFVGVNPLCGDQVELAVKLDKNNRIIDIAWNGAGCAISQAASSMFSEMIKGKTLEQAQNIAKKDLLKTMNIKLSPIRLKCALLPLYTIKKQEMET